MIVPFRFAFFSLGFVEVFVFFVGKLILVVMSLVLVSLPITQFN